MVVAVAGSTTGNQSPHSSEPSYQTNQGFSFLYFSLVSPVSLSLSVRQLNGNDDLCGVQSVSWKSGRSWNDESMLVLS